MVHVRLGKPEVVLLREMMLSARVSNYPDPMSTGQVCPSHHLYRKKKRIA